MMEMAPERRHSSRSRPERGAAVACTSAEFVPAGSPAHNLAVKLLDTSASGACVVTTGRLRQGVPVLVAIAFPGEQRLYKARAVVRWSTTVESKGRTAHVAGLEFDKAMGELGKRASPAAASSASRAPSASSAAIEAKEPQRRHKRFRAEKVEIVCVPRGLLTKLGIKTNPAKGLKDVSLGGAQIVSSEKLKAGTRVDLQLRFNYPRSVVTAVGIVLWCRRDTLSLDPRWNVGVVFKQMDSDSDRQLRTVEAFFNDASPL